VSVDARTQHCPKYFRHNSVLCISKVCDLAHWAVAQPDGKGVQPLFIPSCRKAPPAIKQCLLTDHYPILIGDLLSHYSTCGKPNASDRPPCPIWPDLLPTISWLHPEIAPACLLISLTPAAVGLHSTGVTVSLYRWLLSGVLRNSPLRATCRHRLPWLR